MKLKDQNFEIDTLDKHILNALLQDSRMPFSELAKECKVSDGTIHVRVNKLKEFGIIKGSKIDIDYRALGFRMCAFIGINLEHAKDYQGVLEKLRKIEQITEAYYTTGKYNVFAKVVIPTIEDMHQFLVHILQTIKGIQSTETLVVLDAPITREPSLLGG